MSSPDEKTESLASQSQPSQPSEPPTFDHPIYLDNNATTAMDPQVAAAMAECLAANYLNPASQHSEGRRARQKLEEAREGIGRLLGAQLDHSPTDRVLFTSGGTEANNLAIHGLRSPNMAADAAAKPSDTGTRSDGSEIVVSAIEHPSVLTTATALAAGRTHLAPVLADGTLDIQKFEPLLTPAIRCVSVMLGNNETGAIQPIRKVVELCAPHRIPVHTDAVQAIGKIPVSFTDLGVAAMTATAHKFHGPRGIGVLILRHDTKLEPQMHGGSQQLGSRPGTESVALAVGMWTALKICLAERASREQHMQALRDDLEQRLQAANPTMVVNSRIAQRLPHTLNVSFPGLDRQALLLALDHAGIACSTGSACESGSSQPSHVLLAMQAPAAVVEGSIRISLSAQTTAAEIEQAAQIINATVQLLS